MIYPSSLPEGSLMFLHNCQVSNLSISGGVLYFTGFDRSKHFMGDVPVSWAKIMRYPKHLNSKLDHDLVLKSMVTWGSPILRSTRMTQENRSDGQCVF